MSLVFSDTTNKKGIIQEIESECGFNDGDISGNTLLLQKFTVKVNLALDDYFMLGIKASGEWQVDESNQTDYPIIMMNLKSGQRDYAFTIDGSSNLILDFYKVMVADINGVFKEITPVDQQARDNNVTNVDSFIDGKNLSGTPTRYDKTGNALFLDPIPNYDYSLGIKAFVNREPAYFNYLDTTRKPGIIGSHHRYLVLKASADHLRINSKASYLRVKAEIEDMEITIEESFGKRNREVRKRMRPNVESNK